MARLVGIGGFMILTLDAVKYDKGPYVIGIDIFLIVIYGVGAYSNYKKITGELDAVRETERP